MKKDITLAIVGAGSRGTESYAPRVKNSSYPVRFTAVAEPRESWRERAINNFNIPRKNAFHSWEELLEQPQLADGVIIATQDNLHAAPAQALMRKGYHVMLEKPMATTEEDCRAIIATRQETDRILAICHVMRYSNQARKVKHLLEEGLIGQIVCIQHTEPVGYWHIAHSFVRGNWRSENESSPMILAKSCHDLDILRYWVGEPCRKVSSFGNLLHFKPENRPAGAGDRCLDCPAEIESGCPYSAIKIYLRNHWNNPGWPNSVLSLDTSAKGMVKALREGPYGRCVYACDNDVVDHQVVNLEFENGAVVSFTMAGCSVGGERESWIMGTKGQLRLRGNSAIEHTDFLSDKSNIISIDEDGDPTLATGHAGDEKIVLDFISAIAEDNPELLPSTPEVSLESHLIAFAAEKSRKNGTIETLA